MTAVGDPEAARPPCGSPQPCREWALFCRVLDDGRIMHLIPLMFTFRVCVASASENRSGCFADGWCYAKQRLAAAVHVALFWDGQGDPPGPWIRNVLTGRYGPGANPGDDDEDAA